MKQSKSKQPIIIAGLYVVSLVLFFTSSLFRSIPVLVFSLTYQPLNVTTTATVDVEEFLIMSELNQLIELPSFPQGRYRLDLVTSGGMVAESPMDSGLPTFTLMAGEQTTAIDIDDLIGQQQVTWQQTTTSSIILTLTNFAKINGNLFYGVYVQDIHLYKI
jgi:hypothetical protein